MVANGVTYVRERRVLWRLADDRVLVRKVGNRAPDEDAEVTGSAAVVWLALDEPRTDAELRVALAVAGCAESSDELTVALGLLRQHRLITEQAP